MTMKKRNDIEGAENGTVKKRWRPRGAGWFASSADGDHTAHRWWYTCDGGPTKMDRQGSGRRSRLRVPPTLAANNHSRYWSATTDRHLRPGDEYSRWTDTPAAARCTGGTSTGKAIADCQSCLTGGNVVAPLAGARSHSRPRP